MPPSQLRLAGAWIPKDLVDNLEADCKVLPSDHPYSVVSSEGRLQGASHQLLLTPQLLTTPQPTYMHTQAGTHYAH